MTPHRTPQTPAAASACFLAAAAAAGVHTDPGTIRSAATLSAWQEVDAAYVNGAHAHAAQYAAAARALESGAHAATVR
jgi:hypothetical protein